MLSALVRRAERNKVFRQGWVGARRYVAIDGWEPIASRRRHCAQCLERELSEGKLKLTRFRGRFTTQTGERS